MPFGPVVYHVAWLMSEWRQDEIAQMHPDDDGMRNYDAA